MTGLRFATKIDLTPQPAQLARSQPEDRRDCYWLYVFTSCKPCLQEPIKTPTRFPWHEVKKVDHYYLSVDALTQPMRVREPGEPYGNRSQ
jgi:hypothetical protein